MPAWSLPPPLPQGTDTYAKWDDLDDQDDASDEAAEASAGEALRRGTSHAFAPALDERCHASSTEDTMRFDFGEGTLCPPSPPPTLG